MLNNQTSWVLLCSQSQVKRKSCLKKKNCILTSHFFVSVMHKLISHLLIKLLVLFFVLFYLCTLYLLMSYKILEDRDQIWWTQFVEKSFLGIYANCYISRHFDLVKKVVWLFMLDMLGNQWGLGLKVWGCRGRSWRFVEWFRVLKIGLMQENKGWWKAWGKIGTQTLDEKFLNSLGNF